MRVLVNLQRANTSAPAWNVIPRANSSWYQRASVQTCSRRTRSCSSHCLNDSVGLFKGFCRTWPFTFFTPWSHRTLPWQLVRQRQVNGCSEKRNLWCNKRRLKELSEMLLKAKFRLVLTQMRPTKISPLHIISFCTSSNLGKYRKKSFS